MERIGVLFPAYNEEKNIRAVIKDAKKVLPRATIVVVDDGSTDRTYELAKKEKVIVLRHFVNKGKGEALKTGIDFFRRAGISYAIIADADRQYSIKDAPKFLDALKNADIVTGCRIPSHTLCKQNGKFYLEAALQLLLWHKA